MSSFTSKIKKLKSLKRDEISVRVAQQVAILSERRGWSKHASLPSDEQLLKLLVVPTQSTEALAQHLRTRSEPQFFVPFVAKNETVAEFRRRWPNAERDISNTADHSSAETKLAI